MPQKNKYGPSTEAPERDNYHSWCARERCRVTIAFHDRTPSPEQYARPRRNKGKSDQEVTFPEFFSPEIGEKIQAHPELRKHTIDPGYKKLIDEVQANHALLPKVSAHGV